MVKISKKNLYKNNTASNLRAFVDNYKQITKDKLSGQKNTLSRHHKITDDELVTPTMHNFNSLFLYNYNARQLKLFNKAYNLKTSGNKDELFLALFTHLYLSKIVIKIQKRFRGNLQRKYNTLHGPAVLKRGLCNNLDDFVTLEPIKDISFHQFISFSDESGFIYGCDIISLFTLINSKPNQTIKNPYNRYIIKSDLLSNIQKIVKLSHIFTVNINIKIDVEKDIQLEMLSIREQLEQRSLTLFSDIDNLGYYTNPDWYLLLSSRRLFKFYRELTDIWNYRASLTLITQSEICPPNGNPFNPINLEMLMSNEQISVDDLNRIKLYILTSLEKLVRSGVDTSSRYLGATYLLSALTLVNSDAAMALPLLYESVRYF